MGYILRILLGHSALANEAIGSFLFVLIGTSAITAINITGQATTAVVLLVGSLAFSIALGWLVYLLRRTGLAHLNPVTTIFFWLNGRLSIGRALAYIIAQLFGAITASVVVALLYGTAGIEARLGAPYPLTAMGEWAALAAEFFGTLVLIAAIRVALTRPNLTTAHQSVLIGVGYGLGYILSAGISGGSLNPARALAPQLTAADLTSWWVYAAGPLLAAVIGGIVFRLSEAKAEEAGDISSIPAAPPATQPVGEEEEPTETHDQPGQPEYQYSDEDTELQRKAQQAIQKLHQSNSQPPLPPVETKPSFYPEAEDEEEEAKPEVQAEAAEPATSAKQPAVKFMKYERSGDEEGE